MTDPIHLDHNATTPVAPEVVQAMTEVLAGPWMNPSARYPRAGEVARLVRQAREQVAALLGGHPDEVVFTSGGSEAIATAFHSVGPGGGAASEDGSAAADSSPFTGLRRAVTSTVEHSAVKACAERLAGSAPGGAWVQISVDAEGLLDRAALEAALEEGPCLVSVQVVNNETGVVQDLEGLGEAVRARGGRLHLDAVQAPGKLPLSVAELGADFVTLAAHKFNGPKGVGCLWVAEGAPFTALIPGGAQEGGRRAGTENVAGLVGMGVAASLAAARAADPAFLEAWSARRDAFERRLLAELPPGTRVNGAGAPRVPGTTSLTVPDLPAQEVLTYLDSLGVEASAGSACSAHRVAPSPVLLAMGRSAEEASSTLRLSQGHGTRAEDLDRAAAALVEAVQTLRSLRGLA
ncbi:MAG: cysteine desulfurase [Planctomycetes bacterium]|nr:cysteine desulfurase [Planctomycetota bacterium]